VNFKRAASILTILLTVAMGSPASFASDKDDVVGVVNRYLDNLSTEHPEKVQVALGLCDSRVSILDEFPPHEWQGKTACADWWKGYLAYNLQNHDTGKANQRHSPRKKWTGKNPQQR
jgi:hypothetical protein